MNGGKQEISTRTIILNVFRYALKRKFFWFGLTLLSLIGLGIGLIDPLIIQFLIDDVLIGGRTGLLVTVIVVFASVKLASLAVSYFYGIGFSTFIQKIFYAIRNDLYEDLQYKEIGYFEKKEVGDLIRTLMTDVRATQRILSIGETVFVNVSRLVIILAIIIALEWRLAILAVIAIPIFALVQAVYIRRVRKQAEEAVEADVSLFNFFEERLSNILLVKLFSREASEAARQRMLSRKRVKETVELISEVLIVSTLVGLVSSAGIIAAVWIGAHSVTTGALTIGALTAIYAYVIQMFSPVSALVSIPTSLQQSIVSGRRIFETMGADKEREDGGKISSFRGKIEFDQVTFAYPKKRREKIFTGLTLDIAPGETVGIVGASGVGKTTFVSLLLRFYSPQKGEITIDDRPLTEIARSSLRSLIGVVPQDNLFFPGSIRQNITYAKPFVSESELIFITKAVGIHKTIMKLENGYDTELGPEGKPLSAGERQRLSIARALVKNPDIFIFDEPTAELDAETERIVKKAIKRFSKKRTTIIIAHRFSTLEVVDRILVLKEGRIYESGTFDELLASRGEFARLYRMQQRTGDT